MEKIQKCRPLLEALNAETRLNMHLSRELFSVVACKPKTGS